MKNSNEIRTSITVLALAIICVSIGLLLANAKEGKTEHNIEKRTEIPLESPIVPEVALLTHEDSLIALATAFAIQETRMTERAISPCGRYVGCLQISRIMVREANRLCGVDMFYSDTNVFYDDRLDRQGSLAIFSVVMDYKNPTLDVDRAVDIWNVNAPRLYRNNVKKYYQQALNDTTLTKYWL